MESLSKIEIQELFETHQTKGNVFHYKKSGDFIWRHGIHGETVLTIIAGKLETIKTVEVDSIVLRNIEIGCTAETYIVNAEKFNKRYDLNGKTYKIDGILWIGATAKGEINAFEYFGETIKFTAPWGEEMLCEEGDYIANPIGGPVDDIYRIEKETFYKTYKRKL